MQMFEIRLPLVAHLLVEFGKFLFLVILQHHFLSQKFYFIFLNFLEHFWIRTFRTLGGSREYGCHNHR